MLDLTDLEFFEGLISETDLLARGKENQDFLSSVTLQKREKQIQFVLMLR